MRPEWLALAWLLGLSAIAIGYFYALIRRSDYGLWESFLYLPTYLLGRLLWRVHFKNEAPAEIRSGAILVANHRSSVDPFFVQLAARRRVHWMVAKEYCQHFAFGPMLRALQVIPTNRSGVDTACTKAALRITKAGRLVGMFPEGKLNLTGSVLLPVRSGAAMVALHSDVPMIPLYIEGSPLGKTIWSPLFMPAKVAIVFGQPIFPNNRPRNQPSAALLPNETTNQPTDLADSDELILRWAEQIVSLAGHPNFPVELASKRKRRS